MTITVRDLFITTKVDGSRYLRQAREAIACHTTATGGYEHNSQWQAAWIQHVARTLGGTVFLRLALPATTGQETDILKGLR